MSEVVVGFRKLLDKLKEKYNVRELSACAVVSSNNKSVVIYKERSATIYTICYLEKRETGNLEEALKIVDKYLK